MDITLGAKVRVHKDLPGSVKVTYEGVVTQIGQLAELPYFEMNGTFKFVIGDYRRLEIL